MRHLKGLIFILLSLLVASFSQGCSGFSQQKQEAEPATSTDSQTRVLPALPATTIEPLQPTYTPSDPLSQTAIAPIPTSELDSLIVTPAPSVDLNLPVLRLVYEIPAIGLNRTLEANLAGKLTLTDVTNENVVTISNGQRFLTEIAAAIQTNQALFEPIPADCELCVIIGYDLPAAGQSARGTLPDPTLQVSIQHLFASRLGPHFPPNTLIGHHRSASGYTVAHTAALTADNKLYRWIAADPQITVNQSQTVLDEATLNRLTAEATKFSGVDLSTKCPNFPNEILVFQEAAISVRCPELSLARSLIELYTTAADLTAPLLADGRNLPIPATSLPFSARLYYERRDGSTVTIFNDGTVAATFLVTHTQSLTGTQTITPTVLPPQTVSTSIPPGEIDPLVIPLLASDVIPRGVTITVSNEQTEYEELILIRSADGVYEFAWADGVGQELLPGIQILDLLLDQLRPTADS